MSNQFVEAGFEAPTAYYIHCKNILTIVDRFYNNSISKVRQTTEKRFCHSNYLLKTCIFLAKMLQNTYNIYLLQRVIESSNKL